MSPPLFNIPRIVREFVTGRPEGDEGPTTPTPIRRKRKSQDKSYNDEDYDKDGRPKRLKRYSSPTYRDDDFFRHRKDNQEAESATAQPYVEDLSQSEEEPTQLERPIDHDDNYIGGASPHRRRGQGAGHNPGPAHNLYYSAKDPSEIHATLYRDLKTCKGNYDSVQVHFETLRKAAIQFWAHNLPLEYDSLKTSFENTASEFAGLMAEEKHRGWQGVNGNRDRFAGRGPPPGDGAGREPHPGDDADREPPLEDDVARRTQWGRKRVPRDKPYGVYEQHHQPRWQEQQEVPETASHRPQPKGTRPPPPGSPSLPSPPLPLPLTPGLSRVASLQKTESNTYYDMARNALNRNPSHPSRVASKLKHMLQEPEYVFHDAEIRDAVFALQELMQKFAATYFGFADLDKPRLEEIFRELRPETTRIIGYVASGGPGGEDGWREHFWQSEKRQALVLAIIGNVVSEQVLQHTCFGADRAILENLKKVQRDGRNHDGFERNRAFAKTLSKYLISPATNTLHLPANFEGHAAALVTALWHHLSPILELNPNYSPATIDRIKPAILEILGKIITWAGIIALHMRLDGHTVYHFVPLHKEQLYSEAEHDLFNAAHLAATDPSSPSMQWPQDMSEAEKELARTESKITQVTILNGITAYRKGGWETEESTAAVPRYEALPRKLQSLNANKKSGVRAASAMAEMGVRSRVLTKGWVAARWGRMRAFLNGEPADDKRMHERQWVEPGFVEFVSLEGVPEPPPVKRGLDEGLLVSLIDRLAAVQGERADVAA